MTALYECDDCHEVQKTDQGKFPKDWRARWSEPDRCMLHRCGACASPGKGAKPQREKKRREGGAGPLFGV